MTYHDGSPISLGDVVRVPIPGGNAKARVVMLGDSYEHLDIDAQFLSWVERGRVLPAILRRGGMARQESFCPYGSTLCADRQLHVLSGR